MKKITILIIISLLIIGGNIAIGIDAYGRITELSLDTPIQDVTQGIKDRNSLLEIGLKNQKEKIKLCQETIHANTKAYLEYVERTGDFNTYANRNLSRMEAEVAEYKKRVSNLEEDLKALRGQNDALDTHIRNLTRCQESGECDG